MVNIIRDEDRPVERSGLAERATPTHRVLIHVRRCAPRPARVFEALWRFAVERHAILLRRVAGDPAPWTADPVLASYRFTNAFRACDRVSQYLVRHVIHEGDQAREQVFFRTLLFKIFNRIETWESLTSAVGEVRWEGRWLTRCREVLDESRRRHVPVYSAAYIMPCAELASGSPKHHGHLQLIRTMMEARVGHRFFDAPDMATAFAVLREQPSLGPFLAYQFSIDLNYAPCANFHEMEFVMPGPGARDGLRKCFLSPGDLSDADLIRWTTDRQEEECARLGLTAPVIGSRRLQLIDTQNLFCEIDKYARVVHPEVLGRTRRTRIKQRFRANPAPLRLMFPARWNIDPAVVRLGPQ
jgi:hypothetical protein